MKIWILVGCFNYKIEDIITVHSSKELAELAKIDFEKNNPNAYESYSIEEKEVDVEFS